MFKKLNNLFLIIILAIISLITISALIIQHSLGHEPCNLCLYERIPYFLSILLIIKMLLIKKYKKITLLILSLTFIISAILAFYHFGIEQGFFKESFVCEAKQLSNNLSKDQIMEELKKASVSCKEVSFRILGFSLASINTIFSIILSAIFAKLFLDYERN